MLRRLSLARYPFSAVTILSSLIHYPLQLEEFDGVKLDLCLGTSVGNLSPAEERKILRGLGSRLQAGDALLLGTDLVKDGSILSVTHDDCEGILLE